MDVLVEEKPSVSAAEAALFKHYERQRRVNPGRPDSSVPTRVSMKSDASIKEPIEFASGDKIIEPRSPARLEGPEPPEPSDVSIRSGRSKSEPLDFSENQNYDKQRSHQQHQTKLESVFMRLEKNMAAFIRNELKKLQKVLGSECALDSDGLKDDEEILGAEEEERRRSNRDSCLKLTLNFMRSMKEEELAECLHSKTHAAISQRKIKSNLKNKCQCLFEGVTKAGNPAFLNQIYTELHLTEGECRDANDQHEVRQIEAASWKPTSSKTSIRCEDIFKPLPGRQGAVRTVVTKGVAGIGKTVLTQKFTLDWAEDQANQDTQFIFPFSFRDLNLLKTQNFSLVELLHNVFPETKEAGMCRFEEFRVLFIFDGLDECRLSLDFKSNVILTDVTQSTSVDVLLTNLIRGNLLPSARLWITTRPAAANQIPSECVDMVTEVRGFTDPQKDEYFRKRFRDEEQASRIISHIKTSRSLHIMCHIPVFCWITATVLEDVLKTKGAELPKTLTEMYIHFLLVQTKYGNVKYLGRDETDPVWNKDTEKTVSALGKLAFEQLERGNLIFYEEDLIECGIDIKSASIHSGVLMQIFREERGLNEDKVFCFVHLSVHEFLAALYVLMTFINKGVDLLKKRRLSLHHKSKVKHFYQTAVDKALQSPNGHLDLFVRFLLGLSLETNQSLLRRLLKKTGSNPKDKEKLVQHIKKKLRNCGSVERSINLFHCLNELNDHSLAEEIQQYLRSGRVRENRLSSSQWSALIFILLSSQKDLDVFDLKKFSTSDEGLLSLLPVVKASKTSLLSSCKLSGRSCEALAKVLASKTSNLRELDLSDNELRDTGVKLLSEGLRSPHCRLEVLRLSGCLVTEEGCASLVSALTSNPSHLRELDLSFNHPGDTGLKQLHVGQKDSQWKLETVRDDNCGKCRLEPSPVRYFCKLSLDLNTANRNLSLSDDSRRVIVVTEKQPYPDHPERFDGCKQLLCSDSLTGRCYWEVQWNRRVDIGVTYRGIRRSGDGHDCCIGWNDQSWSLSCTDHSYTAWHNNTPTDIATPKPCGSNRVAVYLDWSAGSVSFYSLPSIVSSIKRIHIHTFHSTFTEPLYPAFGFGQMLEFGSDSARSPLSFYLPHVEE